MCGRSTTSTEPPPKGIEPMAYNLERRNELARAAGFTSYATQRAAKETELAKSHGLTRAEYLRQRRHGTAFGGKPPKSPTVYAKKVGGLYRLSLKDVPVNERHQVLDSFLRSTGKRGITLKTGPGNLTVYQQQTGGIKGATARKVEDIIYDRTGMTVSLSAPAKGPSGWIWEPGRDGSPGSWAADPQTMADAGWIWEPGADGGGQWSAPTEAIARASLDPASSIEDLEDELYIDEHEEKSPKKKKKPAAAAPPPPPPPPPPVDPPLPASATTPRPAAAPGGAPKVKPAKPPKRKPSKPAKRAKRTKRRR